MISIRSFTVRAAFVAGLLCCSLASAQSENPSAYPSRVVKLIVGYQPGGSTDVVGRLVAAELSKRWGKQVIVENKTGADSIIATDAVAKSPPDGYTLLLANSANAIHPSTYAKLPYDPVGDLAPVVMLASAQNVITTSANSPFNTLADVIAYAKANPKNVSYGAGSPPHHLIGESFAQLAKIELTHIPYKGAGPATTDTIAGHVLLNIGTVASQAPHVKSGKLKALAIASATRSPVLPGVPTTAEAGVPNLVGDYWIGITAPPKTPAAIIAKLNGDLNQSLKNAEVLRSFSDLGLEPIGGSPETMSSTLKTEIAHWGNVARTAGIQKQ